MGAVLFSFSEVLFSFPAALFSFSAVLFSFPAVLFSFSAALFSFPAVLFSFVLVQTQSLPTRPRAMHGVCCHAGGGRGGRAVGGWVVGWRRRGEGGVVVGPCLVFLWSCLVFSAVGGRRLGERLDN